MIVGFTGHRPPKAGLTYTHQASGDQAAVDAVRAWLADHIVSHVVVGGALGFDTLAARAALLEGIPFHLYIPFPGQEVKWPRQAQQRYRIMREHAAHEVMVTRGGYSPQAMQVRNMAMVNAADRMLAWWDGSAGGTRNCLDYASQQGVPVTNLYGPDGLWQVTTDRACAGVVVKEGVVEEAAPIFSKFVGQPFTNLQAWSAVQRTVKV